MCIRDSSCSFLNVHVSPPWATSGLISVLCIFICVLWTQCHYWLENRVIFQYRSNSCCHMLIFQTRKTLLVVLLLLYIKMYSQLIDMLHCKSNHLKFTRQILKCHICWLVYYKMCIRDSLLSAVDSVAGTFSRCVDILSVCDI